MVEVQLGVFSDDGRSPPITLNVQNYGERYGIEQPQGTYGRHPLIEAALDYLPVPPGQTIELSIHSEAPSGCSIGTSAALTVAILGALDCLTSGRMNEYEIADAAHKVETEFLHQQCGIQDQIAASFGGINFIEIDKYPHAKVHRITLPTATVRELESRLALIYVGVSHSSSQVHERVIRELQDAGPRAPQLERLRTVAEKSRDALYASDFLAFGESMIENTEAQCHLHLDLVSPAHQQVIDIARRHGALGWKVNGAGGEGGSVTVLGGVNRESRSFMLREIESAAASSRNIPIRLTPSGLRVWDSPVE